MSNKAVHLGDGAIRMGLEHPGGSGVGRIRVGYLEVARFGLGAGLADCAGCVRFRDLGLGTLPPPGSHTFFSNLRY